MLSFKERLKELREDHNLNQRQFAEKLGMARSTISAYEKGSIEPSIKTLFRIADVFKLPLDYFYSTLEMPIAEYRGSIRAAVISKIPADTDIAAELERPDPDTPIEILYFRDLPSTLKADYEKYFIFEENDIHHIIKMQSDFSETDTILACINGCDAQLYSYDEICSAKNVKVIGIVLK